MARGRVRRRVAEMNDKEERKLEKRFNLNVATYSV